MKIEFTAHAWEDFTYWIETDNETASKISELLRAISQDPLKGLGNLSHSSLV